MSIKPQKQKSKKTKNKKDRNLLVQERAAVTANFFTPAIMQFGCATFAEDRRRPQSHRHPHESKRCSMLTWSPDTASMKTKKQDKPPLKPLGTTSDRLYHPGPLYSYGFDFVFP